MNPDVIIIGAGAAGLAALAELDRHGLNVLCLEARDRIGGRIFTLHDPLSPLPIELGAEFIHGRPPEIWQVLQASALAAYDCCEKSVRLKNGKLQDKPDPWSLVDRIMKDLQRAARRRDRTFAEFLARTAYPSNAKQMAVSYVEGFNAARQEVIGIASLAQDEQAADEIGGDHSYRHLHGYDALAHAIVETVSDLPHKLQLNSIVTAIDWHPGDVTIHMRSAVNAHNEVLRCRRALITVPLGVLQAEPSAPGAIRFHPEPSEILETARKLRFGEVVRVILRFKEAFWERKPTLKNAGFFFSDEQFFPTWWTALPIRAPIMTGWSAGPHADGLTGQPRSLVVRRAIESIARITGTTIAKTSELLDSAYYHDWHTDPFSRGAYSYVPAGALPARARLAKPVADTLFFLGEATDQTGHSATVHGAIASGRRAARQILAKS